MTQMAISAEHVDGGTVRIAISGEIDLSNATDLRDQLLAVITNQLTAVALELGGIAYIDSAGLRVLFDLGIRLETLQITLTLRVPLDSPIRRVIELSGLASVASVRPAVQ
jgi:anti-anti-sigma factor